MGNGVTTSAQGAPPPSDVSAAKAPVVDDADDCKAPPPMMNNAYNNNQDGEPLPSVAKTIKVVSLTDDKTVKVVSNDASQSDHKSKADAFKAQGNQLFADGDDVGAAEAYAKAIALDPENHVLYSNRSGAYLRAGKATEALSDALRCIDCCVGWAKGYNRKGAALHTLGRLHDAACAYKEGLAIAPENAPLKEALKLVEGLIKKNRAKEARRQNLATKKDSKLTTAGGKERRRVAGRVRTVGQQGTPPQQARQPQQRPKQRQPRRANAARAQKQSTKPKPPPPKNALPKEKRGDGVTVRKRVSIPGGNGAATAGSGDGAQIKPKRPARRLPKASQKRGEISRAEKVKQSVASPTKGGSKETTTTTTAAAVDAPSATDKPTLAVGAKVRVRGLKGSINGTEGVTQKWNATKSKWMVRLDGRNRALPISETHLEKV